MEPDDPIPQDKPVSVNIRWTCGDGCCSDSQVVAFQPGEVKTIRELCEALENGRGWVLSVYRYEECRRDQYLDRDFPDTYHYQFEEDDREHL